MNSHKSQPLTRNSVAPTPFLKPLRPLQPKVQQKSSRVNLQTKQQHLQEWLRHVDLHKKAGLDTPEMRRYEKIRGFSENYIARLLKLRDKLEQLPTQSLQQRFNVSVRPFYPVEVLLVKLIDEIRNKRIPIDHRFLRIMAQEVYTLLLERVGPLNFPRPSFSLNWVYKFKSHWKIQYFKMKGEAGSVDMQKIAPEVERIKNTIAEYDLEDVYNADETGLFLQTLSDWTLGREKTSGYRSATSRASILFCVNATGTDKRKPLVLNGYHTDVKLKVAVEIYSLSHKRSKGKSKKAKEAEACSDAMEKEPDNEAEDSLDAMEVTQDATDEKKIKITGYNTAIIFLEWLERFQKSITSKDPSRKILLLVDNAGCHGEKVLNKAHLFPNIRLEYLPANSTSVTQPLDAGVIAVFKLRYRQIIGDRTFQLRFVDHLATPQEHKKSSLPKVSNLEAWKTIVRAWSHVKPESIRNCWHHVPILCDNQKRQLRDLNETTDTDRPSPPIDPCVLEAILSRRDIDILMDSQEQSDSEGALDIPHQFSGRRPPPVDNCPREEVSRELELEVKAGLQFSAEACRKSMARLHELHDQLQDLRVITQNIVNKQSGHPPEPLDNPPGNSNTPPKPLDSGTQLVTDGKRWISDIERDRATCLASALDGSPLLCKLIDDCHGDKMFMTYFRPGSKDTVTLGDNWFPSDDEPEDEDFSMDSKSSLSDSSDIGYEEDDRGQQDDVCEMDYDDTHSLLIHAAEVIPERHTAIRERLEVLADSGLGPDIFDADAIYTSQFNASQRKKEERYIQHRIHDDKLKKKYPGVKFPPTTLGTVSFPVEDMET